jgi:hypothetical protein
MRTMPSPRSSGRTDLNPTANEGRARPRRRPPKIALVVACSQRKRTPPPIGLQVSSIDAPANERLKEWRRRLNEVGVRELKAHDLYMGDHWQAALKAYQLAQRYSSRTELWVISAGYGLIGSSKLIKPYSATFASGSADSVWRGPCDGEQRSFLHQWWEGLPHEATLAELLRHDGRIVIAAGAPYLAVLRVDLASALGHHQSADRISVVSAGSRGNGVLLPVTGAFRAAVGGTDASLNTRLLALLAAEAPSHGFQRSRMAAALNRMANGSRFSMARRAPGTAVTDREVAQIIEEILRRLPTASRTYALRELRQAGMACGQSRFASIWQATVRERRAETH